jgi:ABC-2 type transport system permease protein
VTIEFNIWKNVCRVARNEFARVFSHPLTPAIVAILAFLSILNGIGGTDNLGGGRSQEGLYYSIGQNFMYSAVYCGIVSVFIGVFSIAEENRNRSINILQSKPLYRRDLVAGKLLGLNIYIFCVITLAMALAALTLIVFYLSPADPADFMARVAAYILLLFIYSSLSIAIAMLISIVIKDLMLAATLAMAYVFIDWYTGLKSVIPYLRNFSPESAICRLYINDAASLQSAASTMNQWINANAAGLFFFITAVILVSLITLALYSRGENT